MPRCDCRGDTVHPWYAINLPTNASNLGQTGQGLLRLAPGLNNAPGRLSMNDNLGSNVPWYDPVPLGLAGATLPSSRAYDVDLEAVFRKQKFISFLISKPVAAGPPFQIHKKVTWEINLVINFDKSRPLGSRLVSVRDIAPPVSIEDRTPTMTLPACLLATACAGNMNGSGFNGYTQRAAPRLNGAIGMNRTAPASRWVMGPYRGAATATAVAPTVSTHVSKSEVS